MFAFGVAIIGVTPRTGAADQATWPQFGGSKANFSVTKSPAWHRQPPTKRWQRKLGPGMSGLVADSNRVYTIFLEPFTEDELQQDESKRTHREVVMAFDADNGEPQWSYAYDAGWIDSQQAFGGRVRAPQATPLICGDRLVTIGFTGKMHCFDRSTGKHMWERSLVEKFEAVPVQFGFSASPVYDDDTLFVLSGGKGGGLVAMNLTDGNVRWKVPCNEASYATPVIWNRKDGKQIVFVTRNRVVGVSADDGRELWEHRLHGKGLTNVPTPMPVGKQDLVISGQGVHGTRRLSIKPTADQFVVSEVWKSDAQFFYCNWVQHGGKLIGCNGKLLIAIDLKSGKTLGRYRGYSDANLLLVGDTLLVYHGDGHLSRLKLSSRQLDVLATYSIFDDRCWTPPTLASDFLYCRGGDQLLCLDMAGGDKRAAVVPTRIRKAKLVFKTSAGQGTTEDKNEPQATPLEQIVSAYERQGANAAWETYSKIRSEDPDALSFTERRSLSQMAKEQGLERFAKLIDTHAAEDFRKESQQLKDALNPPSTKRLAANGLTYLKFSLRNTTRSTIQAEVQGPSKHPFGYGLPLRPDVPRLEDWPIGTKLYRTVLGKRNELLLTVDESFAGQIIDVPQKQQTGKGK